jgi:hypothetical protein
MKGYKPIAASFLLDALRRFDVKRIETGQSVLILRINYDFVLDHWPSAHKRGIVYS